MQRQGMTVIFSSLTMEFLDQEQPHPKNLKKSRGKSRGDPCRTPLALTLQRKMNVGLFEKYKERDG